jgi:hypothetical protein
MFYFFLLGEQIKIYNDASPPSSKAKLKMCVSIGAFLPDLSIVYCAGASVLCTR